VGLAEVGADVVLVLPDVLVELDEVLLAPNVLETIKAAGRPASAADKIEDSLRKDRRLEFLSIMRVF
jgi:hypothetical protein